MSLMLSEIGQAGDAAERLLARNAEAFATLGARLRAKPPPVVVTIARGSSDHCALYLKYLLEVAVGTPCASIGPSIASHYDAKLALKGALAVAISQSGRSPVLVSMQRAARAGGALTLAFVNDETSPLAEDAAIALPLCAGPEFSVAATKSMIAGLVAGAALVAAWSEDLSLSLGLQRLPEALRAQNIAAPEAMAERLARSRSLYVLGRGATLPIAAEAALKLKETSAMHAEAFSSAEVLHGPAEIVGPDFPVLAFLPQDAAREGFEATLTRLANMGADILRVDSGGADSPSRLAVAEVEPRLAPIAMVARFYRLAERIAALRGRNPDKPRNLSKVTETR